MCHLSDIHDNNTILKHISEVKFKEQYLVTRVPYQLMQSLKAVLSTAFRLLTEL